ncbi:hypothetical protein [Nocardioides sp.]|uniref:hypothetical protein n=1 Tax=Nocardioides sp. TaxID=35761 RepID=UPI0025E0452D|nr:hypothetical protein [Nocardioides sp.]
MNSISLVRRGAAAAAVTACVATGLATAVSTGPAHAEERDAARAVPKTTITFEVPDCEGCEVAIMQGRWDPDAKIGMRVWDGGQKTVEDGVVTFRIPTKRTEGLSMTVRAPWEGHTGYMTTVAFRYAGEKVGDEIGFRQAREKTKATACWAGTDADAVTVPLTVRKVWVEGVRHRVRGSIAFANVTQDWMQPMRAVWDGILGSQEVNICGEQPKG